MGVVGLFSDTEGDVERVDAALMFLRQKGATRYFFMGNRYDDVEAWVKWKRDQARAQADYSDADFLEDVVDHLSGKEPRDRPPAFGQAYEAARTAETLARLKDKVLRVPEKGCTAYGAPSVPRKLVDMMGDTLCCLVHDKNDLDKEDMTNAVVLIHGKGEAPAMVQIGPRYFVTPGRVTSPTPSVGLLEMDDKGLRFSAYALSGQTLVEPTALSVGGRKKVSVS